jgi:hypothetical protein
MTEAEMLKLARACGASVEQWMTQTPKPLAVHFELEHLARFVAAIRESERKAQIKQGVEPVQADPLSDLRERSSGMEAPIVHDWRISDKLGGEVCAKCSAMRGTRRGNPPCG